MSANRVMPDDMLGEVGRKVESPERYCIWTNVPLSNFFVLTRGVVSRKAAHITTVCIVDPEPASIDNEIEESIRLGNAWEKS